MPQIINSFEEFILASVKNPHAHFKVNPDDTLTVYNQEDKWTSRFGNVKAFVKKGFSAESVRATNNWAVARWVDEKASEFRDTHPNSKLANFGKLHVTSVRSGGDNFAGEELMHYLQAAYPEKSEQDLQEKMETILRKLRITEIRVKASRDNWRSADTWGSYFATLGGNNTGSTSSIASLAALDTGHRRAMEKKFIFADALDEDLYTATNKIAEETQRVTEAQRAEEVNEVETVELNSGRVKDFARRFTEHVEKIRNYRMDSAFQNEFYEQYMKPFHSLENEMEELELQIRISKEEMTTRAGKSELATLEKIIERAKKTTFASKDTPTINDKYLEKVHDTYCLLEDFDEQIGEVLTVNGIEEAIEMGHPFKIDHTTNQFVYVAEKGTIPIALTSGKLVGHIPERLISLEDALAQGRIHRSTALMLKLYAMLDNEDAKRQFIRDTANIHGAGKKLFEVFTKENSGAKIEQELRTTWETICAINHLTQTYRDSKGQLTHPKLKEGLQLLAERHATLARAFDVKFQQIKKTHQFIQNQNGDLCLANKEHMTVVNADQVGAITFARLYHIHTKNDVPKEEARMNNQRIRNLEKVAGILKDDINLDIDYSKLPYLLREIATHLKQCDEKNMSTEDSSRILNSYYAQELPSLSDAALQKFFEDATEALSTVGDIPDADESTMTPGVNPSVRNRVQDVYYLIDAEITKRTAKATAPASELIAASNLGNIPPEDLVHLFESIVEKGENYEFAVIPVNHMKAGSEYNYVRFTEQDKKDYQEAIDYIFGLLKSVKPDVRVKQARMLEKAVILYKTILEDAREFNGGVSASNKDHAIVLDGLHSRLHKLVKELDAAAFKEAGFEKMGKPGLPVVINDASKIKEAPALAQARQDDEVKAKPKPLVMPKPVHYGFPEGPVSKIIIAPEGEEESVIKKKPANTIVFGATNANEEEEVIVKKKPAKTLAQTEPLSADKKAQNALVDELINEVILKQERAMLPNEARKKPVNVLEAKVAISSFLEAIKNEKRWTKEYDQLSARMQAIANDQTPNYQADLRALSSESDRVTGERVQADAAKSAAKNRLRQFLANQSITDAQAVINNILAHVKLVEESKELVAEQALRGASGKGAVQLPYKTGH